MNDQSRLWMRLREKDGLCYDARSTLQIDAHDESGAITAYASCNPLNTERVVDAIKHELARVLKDGFTEEEIATAKSGFLQARQTERGQDATLAATLVKYLYLNRRFTFDAALERKIRELTPAHILEAMQKHIDPARISFYKAGDFSHRQAAR